MAITQDGFITGGKVADGKGLLRSKEARKSRKMTYLSKFCFAIGILLIVLATITVFSDSYTTVTAETGYSERTNQITSAFINYVLGLYNLFIGVSGKVLNRHVTKPFTWAWVPILGFVVFLNFNPLFDARSMNFDEWTKARYGIEGVEKGLLKNSPIVYPTKDGEKAGELKKIDDQYFIYDAATDKEIPRASDTVYVLTK